MGEGEGANGKEGSCNIGWEGEERDGGRFLFFVNRVFSGEGRREKWYG